jgi:hypothetical protein
LNVPIPIDMFNFMVCDAYNLNTTHCYSGVSEFSLNQTLDIPIWRRQDKMA